MAFQIKTCKLEEHDDAKSTMPSFPKQGFGDHLLAASKPLDQGLAPPVNDDVGEDPSTTMLEMYFKSFVPNHYSVTKWFANFCFREALMEKKR